MSGLSDTERRIIDRLRAWLAESPRRPAVTAFTAGFERQLAYAIEEAETRARMEHAHGR